MCRIARLPVGAVSCGGASRLSRRGGRDVLRRPFLDRAGHPCDEAVAERCQEAGPGKYLDGADGLLPPPGEPGLGRARRLPLRGQSPYAPEVRHRDMRVRPLEQTVQRSRIVAPGGVEQPTVANGLMQVEAVQDRSQLDVLELVDDQQGQQIGRRGPRRRNRPERLLGSGTDIAAVRRVQRGEDPSPAATPGA